jgi:hypothetical protein
MAFNYNNSTFVSFAVFADVVQRDSRLFEANEVVNDSTLINDLLTLSSQRILSKIKNTDWWAKYNFDRNASLQNDIRRVPDVNPDKIDGMQQEFKDLNIYHVLFEYVLPKVADFGNPDSAEVQKIKHYKDQFDMLYKEIIEAGSWYDYSGDNTISYTEVQPVTVNRVRTR